MGCSGVMAKSLFAKPGLLIHTNSSQTREVRIVLEPE